MCDIKFTISNKNGKFVLKLYTRNMKILSMKPKKKDLQELVNSINNNIEYSYKEEIEPYHNKEFSISPINKTVCFDTIEKKSNGTYRYKKEYDDFVNELLLHLKDLDIQIDLTFPFKSTFNVESYLLNNFKGVITSTNIFLKNFDGDWLDWFTGASLNKIDHDGKKYYFVAGIEFDDYQLYGFVFNEDKKMLAGITSENWEEDLEEYAFIDIPSFPHDLPFEMKNKIKKFAKTLLP